MAEFSEQRFPSLNKYFRRMRPWDIGPFKAAHEGVALLLSLGALDAVIGLTTSNTFFLDVVSSPARVLSWEEYQDWLIERVGELDGPNRLVRSEDAFGLQGPGIGFYSVGPQGDRTKLVLNRSGFSLP